MKRGEKGGGVGSSSATLRDQKIRVNFNFL